MPKNSTKRLAAVVVLVIILAIIIGSNSLKSIGIGGATTYKFIYFNTYAYPSMAQLPATVFYTFNAPVVGKITGVCNTNVEYFNLGYSVVELDAPTKSGDYPISQAYSKGNGANIALCEITLPAQEYNTTSGTLTVNATASGYSSATYSASLDIQSIYSAGLGQQYPVIITIPLTATSNNTTTTQPTTTLTPSNTTTITSTQPTTSVITTTTTSTIPPTTNTSTNSTGQQNSNQSSFLGGIISALQSLINSIISALENLFRV